MHVVERFRRQWRAVPIGLMSVWIEMEVPKVECQSCGARRRIEVAFADPKRQHTHGFERYVMDLLACMTPQDVARHLGISWDLANDIQKRRLKGIRWLLLMNSENIDDEDDRTQLEEALRFNRPLVTAYYLKEELRQFWEQENYHAAARFLTA